MPVDESAPPVVIDPVAAAVEAHVRDMEAAGHGKFSVTRDGEEMVVAFGWVEVRGETYDVALVRLASALLDSEIFGSLFLARMRNPLRNPPAANLQDNCLGVRKAEGRR